MRSTLILLVIAIIFVIHGLSLNFTQDDAFISYRYVKNFLEGNGLVFNSGERVEGYTNFLWIILLSIFAKLGLDMILVSKIIGVVSGCLTLFLVYRISQIFFSEKAWLLTLFPAFLLSANGAFAYWSTSGLETTFFTMMALLCVYLYLTSPRLWVVSCAVSALVRPEGALVFGILILHELLFRKHRFGALVGHLALFVMFLLPFVVFKLLYYGDVLPNPFYAKTGFSLDYLKSGLEYFWLFLRRYGLWGLTYVIPALFYKRLDTKGYLLMLLVYLFTLYVILVGGDVLKVHRFFLPILPLSYLLLVVCLRQLSSRFKSRIARRIAVVFPLVAISLVFFLLPHKWIRRVRADERTLVERMRPVAEYLKKNYGPSFSLAVTTIGSVSYYAGPEAKVIDMLGLTDSYISRYPEEIEGIAATWKEKRYNTQYVLSLDPDFILFPTGFKPSAPAERALLLNSEFRENYYAIPVVFGKQQFFPVFRRKETYLKENQVFGDPRFVDLFYQAVHLHIRGNDQEAIHKLKQVIEIGPKDFALAHELVGRYYFLAGDHPNAETYLKKAIAIDDRTVLAHLYLRVIYESTGRLEEAEVEKQKVSLYDPNLKW